MARFRIAQLAQERGMSIAELHRRIIETAPDGKPRQRRIAYRTLIRIINNHTQSPEQDTLEGIARALGTTVPGLYEVETPANGEGDGQKNLEPLCA